MYVIFFRGIPEVDFLLNKKSDLCFFLFTPEEITIILDAFSPILSFFLTKSCSNFMLDSKSLCEKADGFCLAAKQRKPKNTLNFYF